MPLPTDAETCPTPSQLAEYSQGLLTEEGSARIESHLASCDTCEATLQVVDAKVGTVVTPKRELEADPYEQEESMAEAVDAAVKLGRDAKSGTILKATDEEAAEERTLGQYRLLEKLGEGGMGAVYKALHTKLDRVVALKLLSSAALQDQSAVARFEREMRAVGKLQHPNIVGAHDAGDVDGTHYLVMELVDGHDLSQVLARSGALPTGTACELARQAAMGLQHAHEHGMVHRDIKPSNLMLTGEGVVKILDMGLALLSEHHHAGNGELTGTGVLMGTLDYMAPEQGADTHNVDVRADVYSLGATLYKLLAGRAPFGGEQYTTPIQKLQALAIKEPERIESVRPGLPAGLADVVHRMLAKDPNERYATPAEVAEALAPYADAGLAGLAEDPLTSINEGSGTNVDQQTVVQGSSTRVADLAPTVVSGAVEAPRTRQESGGGRSGPPAWTLYGGLAGAAAALLLGLVFFLPTKNGTIRVEIDDPDVKVEVTAAGVVVTEKDGEPVTVEPGSHTLKITRGDFSFTSDAFTVTKGEEVVVKVELLDATIKVSKTDGTNLGEGTDDGSVVVADGGGRGEPRGPGGERVEGVVDSDGLPRGAINAIDASPDGKLIAATFSAGKLALVDAKTFEVKSVIGDGTPITKPQWSPDSRFLSVAVGEELQILKADGTVATRVLGAPMQRFFWHPKSRWLVATWSQHGKTNVWFVNPETSQKIEYNRDGEVRGGLGGAEWSADGKQLLVSCSWGIVLFDDEGKVAEKIEHPGLLLATWHPDGDNFLVARSGKPNREVALLNRKGEVVETRHDIGRGLTNFVADRDLGLLEVSGDVIRYGWEGENQRFGVHGLFSRLHFVKRRPGGTDGFAVLSPKNEHNPLLPHVVEIDEHGPKQPRQFELESAAIEWNADGTKLFAAPKLHEEEGLLVALDPRSGEVLRRLARPERAASDRPEYDLTDEQKAFFAATKFLPVERKRETVLAKLGWTGDAEARKDVYEFADGDVRAVNLKSGRITQLWPLLVYPKLERVDVTGTRVGDFRVLAQFPLTELEIDLTLYNLKSEEALRGIHTLARVNGTPAAEFWATREKHRQEIAEMREAAKSLQHADVLAWLEKKIDELNPGQHVSWSSRRPTDGANVAAYWKYEGRGSVYLRGCGAVREFGPLRALDFVEIGGQMGGDLHVLAGLPLESVSFSGTHFNDLTPLEGMELRKFHLNNCGLRDLGSLRGMPLTSVSVSRNPVSDLTPLKGASLELLNVSGTPVADLSPLEGMSLKNLDCSGTPVSDVSVLAGMPIEGLSLGIGNGHPHDAYRWERWGPVWQPVRDLSPLKGMPLKSLSFDHVLEDDSYDALLMELPLERINGLAAEEFWKRVEKQRAEAAGGE